MRSLNRYLGFVLLSLFAIILTSCGAYVGASGYPNESYVYHDQYYAYPPTEPYAYAPYYGYYGYYGHTRPYYRGRNHEERERMEHRRFEHERRERGERGEHHRLG